MSSITAQFLFAGFMQFTQANPDKAALTVNNYCNDGLSDTGTLLETASLMEAVGEYADCRAGGKQDGVAGTWEIDIVLPFGNKLAAWASEGRVLTLAEMVESLDRETDVWIAANMAKIQEGLN
jgi:hypothetical protein